jgi:PAS domain S-box-containing protein
VQFTLPALIVVLSVAGYLMTAAMIRGDRDDAAARRAEVESVRTQAVLGRARAYLVSLGNALAAERAPSARRFALLQGSAAGTVGLTGALWIERVPAARRRAYERRAGVPITRLTRAGREERAPTAASYLPATYLTGTLLRRGVDVSSWPALAAAIRDPASVFAGTASRLGSLGDRPGFFLLEAGRFGRGPGSRGVLAVFVPRGWLTVSLESDPRRFAVALDGRRLEGRLEGEPAAGRTFAALARKWRLETGREPASRLESIVPWLALAWPPTTAALGYMVARGVLRRRRAEREVTRIFDLSLDLLCVANLDGYFTRVNPAFEHTLGYSSEQLLARPFADFIHPDDRSAAGEAMHTLARGQELVRFENRYLRDDGSICWLQWSVRPVPDEGLVYGAARDVTENRRAQDELRHAQRMVESSRDELRVLADEQAALRRVATLVARRAPPQELFDAVAVEVGRLLAADAAALLRYEPDGSATVLAAYGERDADNPVGTRLPLEGDNVPAAVRRRGRATRMDARSGAAGALAARREALGIRTAVGTPIMAEGRVWGVVIGAWRQDAPVPSDAEERMTQFTELVATAIANAESRAELAASRARVVTAADETRRRIERDLHDGAQQRLVSLALGLRAAEAMVPPGHGGLKHELSQTAEGLAGVVEDLQEMSRGIHPAILSKGGLEPALKTLARRCAVPVELEVHAASRLPEPVEVAAYYVVSEALTNAVKHAQASVVHVAVATEDSVVDVAIRDDGVGGADPAEGSGLVGLRDRVEALGGTIEITSGAGTGTSLVARIPLPSSG